MSSTSFEVVARAGAARRGRLATAHGIIETPCFMPVGTLGAVKGLGPDQLEEAGASVMLANLYHLSLRPGTAAIPRSPACQSPGGRLNSALWRSLSRSQPATSAGEWS